MSELLADLVAARPVLPYTSRHGLSVERIGRAVYINGHHHSPVDALDYSAAIARAVHEAAEHMTAPSHPEGA